MTEKKLSMKLSPQTESLINGDVNKIVGSSTCPHCSKFSKFVNGQLEGYSLKVGKHGAVNLGTDWQEFDRALNSTIKAKETIAKTCSEKKLLSPEQCDEFGFLADEHFKELEFLKEKEIDFDKVRKKFEMVYMEDISTINQISELDKILNLETVPSIVLSECGDKKRTCKRTGVLDPVKMVLHVAIQNKDDSKIQKVKNFLEGKRKRTLEHSKNHDSKDDYEKLIKYYQTNTIDDMIKNWWNHED